SGERFFELWNLVFMQFNRSADGQMTPLPKPSVDTGMGLERLACVMQKVDSNWETDLFSPIIQTIAKITSVRESESPSVQIAMRVIADHVRAATFLIGDGLFPSNEGRGYVLRRILRRAIRYARSLGIDKPFFAAVSQTVRDEMGEAYPEIVRHQATIDKVLTHEEERFLETLDRGMEILDQEFAVLEKSKQKIIPGDVVFKLYDTFGFPKDLTDLIAREKSFSIDEAGFEREMEKQRERARKAWKGSGAIKVESVYQKIKGEGFSTQFVGYEKEKEKGEVMRLIKEGKVVEGAKAGETIQLITDVTPFYAEGGGQVGDTGMGLEKEVELEIFDTQKPFSDLFVHLAKVVSGEIAPKEKLLLEIDSIRRQKIRCSHTATHLLHAALRQTLGEHVKQAGSYLDDKYFRFDFSHFGPISDEQLADIEALVNKEIQANLPITTKILPYPEAIAEGALAYFGEKYGDIVRMVAIKGFSKELCGGTHVASTGEIGLVKLVKERSVASGVRRIEAVSGQAALEFTCRRGALDAVEKQRGKEVEKQRQEEKSAQANRLQKALSQFDVLAKNAKEVRGAKVLAARVDAATSQELREIADAYKQKLGSGVVVLGAVIQDKAALVVAVTPDLVSKFSAGEIVKKLAAMLGGTGGGRPDMAQGGGPDVAKLQEVLSQIGVLLGER
ncbi:MAG: alanine--tRNA ligase, partial [bacterium]|nr:alanine--tRNA ligase [bacterium]